MVSQNSRLDPEFIERQRGRLEALRAELTGIEREVNEEERDLETEYAAEVADSGDQSQNLYAREVDAGFHDEAERRLRRVMRNCSDEKIG